jgi:uncharacterized protein
MPRSLSVVLKTAERCNIDCDYCYFFHAGDASYLRHPKVISKKTLAAVTAFLREGIESLGIEELHIVFHGGEPMLQRRTDFDTMCSQFRELLAPSLRLLALGIQTNGTLIDDDWVDTFIRHDIQVGISLDGPRHINDAHRVDHRGRGTYDRTVRGLRRLQEAARTGRLAEEPGVLCVINPELPARQALAHLVDELGVKSMDFLLPDLNPDSVGDRDLRIFGPYLCELFDAWRTRQHEGVEIKIVSALMQRLGGRPSFLFDHVRDQTDAGAFVAITISSDGSIAPDDSMRSTALWRRLPACNVREMRLEEFLSTPAMVDLLCARCQIPESCTGCIWEHVCGGGFGQTRWSADRGHNNPSVYCAALKEIYLHVAADLALRGAPRVFFQQALAGEMHGR